VIVNAADAGQRLDRWLAARLPELSRARLQALIDQGRVTVGGRARKAAYRVREGEPVLVEIPPPAAPELRPEALPLEIVYEDDAVLVVNKVAGMVVHPGAGQATGTLAAAVLARAPETAAVGSPRRPGIVHRLDKGTSGLLVIAKTRPAFDSLVAQLAARTVTRRYLAIVHGLPARSEGVIDAPIGRHPRDRRRMAVRPAGQGRRAVTRYRVLERFPAVPATYLEARLETGRTHQIRVHLAAQGHPVLGDDTYRGRSSRRPDLDPAGLALHAAELAFVHPLTGERVAFTASLPQRLERLLAHLRSVQGHGVRPRR
jgi:23S rRNA pseudouridine1911/1915/1917 synthase